MEDRSGCMLGVLVLVVLLNGIGLYLVIDSNSRATRAQAETTRVLSAMQQRLGGIQTAIERGGLPRASTTTASDVDAGRPVLFANEEFLQPETEEGGRVITATQALGGNLNYLITNESSTGDVWEMLLDSLAERNWMNVMEFEPKLARSWEVSEDGLVYTIHLRDTAMWQAYTDPETGMKVEAHPVTSDDFLFYWEVIQNPKIPCDPIRTYFELMDRIEVVDDFTFRVIWKEPYALAEGMTLGLSPLPRHYYRPDPDMNDEAFVDSFQQSQRNQFMIGFGAYLIDSYEPAARLTFRRNENYYGNKPPIKTVTWRVIAEPSVQLVEFKKGDLDRVGLLPEQWLRETTGRDFYVVTPKVDTAIEDSWAYDALKREGNAPLAHKFEKVLYPSRGWSYIGYNMRRPLFEDVRVRRALTHLTNRERILRDVYHNFATIMAGPFIHSSPYADPDIKPLAFDPERAAALLKEAGWEDTTGDGWLDKDLTGDGTRTPFRFAFMSISSSVTQRRFLVIMQQDFREAGIDMQIQPFEWSVYLEKLQEYDYDVCSLAWTGTIEPDPYQIWHGSQADLPRSSNHVGYKNPEADRLIEEGRKTLDPEARKEIYRKFYRIVHEDQPYTFLFNPTVLLTVDRRFRNVRSYRIGAPSTYQWVPVMEQKTAP